MNIKFFNFFNRDEKLTKLQNLLTMHAEHKTITHLELASIGDKNLMKKILDVVSSYDLNLFSRLFKLIYFNLKRIY